MLILHFLLHQQECHCSILTKAFNPNHIFLKIVFGYGKIDFPKKQFSNFPTLGEVNDEKSFSTPIRENNFHPRSKELDFLPSTPFMIKSAEI